MTNKTNMNKQSGNVLFLILIAVALFAALSYAVTQSTRSGGDTGSEKAGLSAAQISQYPAGVKTGVLRMVIGGVEATDLEFNPPSDFASCTGATTSYRFCVFHPQGGGAPYSESPADAMASGGVGTWHFNASMEVANVGTTSSGDPDGNEIIAFLPGITETVCNKINEESGIALTGDFNTAADLSTTGYLTDMEDGYTVPNEVGILGDASSLALSGQPIGCFENNSTDTFVYYHVLLER